MHRNRKKKRIKRHTYIKTKTRATRKQLTSLFCRTTAAEIKNIFKVYEKKEEEKNVCGERQSVC